MPPKPATLEDCFQRIGALMGGNPGALELIRDLHRISHVWDDLIDGDRHVTPQAINAAFIAATVGLALNPFYQQNIRVIAPVMLTGILNWRAANAMEAAGEHLEIAHVIRCSLADVALLCAALCMGHERAAEAAAELRVLFQQDELATYLAEHQGAAA